MTLLIDNDVANAVLTTRDAVAELRDIFRELAVGDAADRNKTSMYVPQPDPHLWYRYASMEGVSRSRRLAAVRIKSDMVHYERRGEAVREQKYTATPGMFGGLILLFSTDSGKLLAIVNDGHIQHVRVGSTYGVGADVLARHDAQTVGIIGSGGMARSCLSAFCIVRPISHVKVYSPTRDNAQRFAKEMEAELGVAVEVVDSPRVAAAGVDILASATDSRAPVLFADMIEPGMHVSSIADVFEVDEGVFSRCDTIVTERTGISQHIATGPEREDLPYGGSRPKLEKSYDVVPPDRRVHLHDVITGSKDGRRSDRDTTYFSSEGMGTQFVAIAGLVYRLARQNGLGRELPDEWFLQDIRT